MENIETTDTTDTVEVVDEKKPNFIVRGSKKVGQFIRSKSGKATVVALGLAAAVAGTYAAGFRKGTDNTIDILSFDINTDYESGEEEVSDDNVDLDTDVDTAIDDAPEDSSSE